MNRPRFNPADFRRATAAMCDSMDEDYHRCSSPTCRSNKRLADELARASGGSTPTTGYFTQQFSGGDGRQTPLSETEMLMNRRSGELRCKNKDEDYHRCKSPTCRGNKRLLDELERANKSAGLHRTSFDESSTTDLTSPVEFTDSKEQVHETRQASVQHQDRNESRPADTKPPMINRYDSVGRVESTPKPEPISTAVYYRQPVKLERQAFQKHAVKPSLPCFACHHIHDNDVTAFGITEDECRRRYLFGTCVQCKQGRSDFQYCHNCHLADDYSLFYEEDSDTDSD